MTWELAYAVFGAPLLLVVFGFVMLRVTRFLERRERRTYDDAGRPRIAGGPAR